MPHQDYKCAEVAPAPECGDGRVRAKLYPLDAYVSGVDMISDCNGMFGKFEFRAGVIYRLTELTAPPKPEGDD